MILGFLKSFRKSKKKLILTLTQDIVWSDLDDLKETIYFYIFEDDYGNRSYEVYEYGYCKICKKHKKFLGEVLRWVHSGDTRVLINEWVKDTVSPPPKLMKKPKLELVAKDDSNSPRN